MTIYTGKDARRAPEGKLATHKYMNDADTSVNFDFTLTGLSPELYELKINTYNDDLSERHEHELLLSRTMAAELAEMIQLVLVKKK